MDALLIEKYAEGGDKLRQSISGLTRDDMLAFPVPGTWSIQQIIVHLMDSDLIAADRMKRIIAEDNPTILAYDENRFVQNLFYDQQPADDAVTIFDLNRKLFATVLRQLPQAAFARKGTHNKTGPTTLGEMLETYVNHLQHHLKFVYQKREKMGKSMW